MTTATLLLAFCAQDAYTVRESHPRLLIHDPPGLLRRCDGALKEDYAVVKERADRALKDGVQYIGNKWAIPEDLMNLGLAYLVERARGGDAERYVRAVVRQWGDGRILSDAKGCAFGYHALAYDWVYDGPNQRDCVSFRLQRIALAP